jgi:hypothetical protein
VTEYHAGVAAMRCEEHSRAGEVDGVARAVLAAMGLFVAPGELSDRRPVCAAPLGRVAVVAGFERKTVRRAQRRLDALGLIEPDGEAEPGSAARWHLPILAGAERWCREVAEPDAVPR